MTPRAPVRALVVGLLWAGSGCTYTVRMLSDPSGALVTLPDGRTVVTPTEASFRWGRKQPVVVEARGHRPLEVDMNRTEGPFLRFTGAAVFQAGSREVTFLLVPERAPVSHEAPE